MGKSTLMNSMFLTDLYNAQYPGPSLRSQKTVKVGHLKSLWGVWGLILKCEVEWCSSFTHVISYFCAHRSCLKPFMLSLSTLESALSYESCCVMMIFSWWKINYWMAGGEDAGGIERGRSSAQVDCGWYSWIWRFCGQHQLVSGGCCHPHFNSLLPIRLLKAFN